MTASEFINLLALGAVAGSILIGWLIYREEYKE